MQAFECPALWCFWKLGKDRSKGGGYRLLLRRDGRTQAIGGLLALGFDSSSRRAGAALILGCGAAAGSSRMKAAPSAALLWQDGLLVGIDLVLHVDLDVGLRLGDGVRVIFGEIHLAEVERLKLLGVKPRQ
jgi:hypothetical protein